MNKMCETGRIDKVQSEREETSSTIAQPGSPHWVPQQGPSTSWTRKSSQDDSHQSPLEASNRWLPDLKIAEDAISASTPGRKRRVSEIISDIEPPESDKMWNNLSDMLAQEKAKNDDEPPTTKRRKFEIRGSRSEASGAALDRIPSTQGGTSPLASSEMGGSHAPVGPELQSAPRRQLPQLPVDHLPDSAPARPRRRRHRPR